MYFLVDIRVSTHLVMMSCDVMMWCDVIWFVTTMRNKVTIYRRITYDNRWVYTDFMLVYDVQQFNYITFNVVWQLWLMLLLLLTSLVILLLRCTNGSYIIYIYYIYINIYIHIRPFAIEWIPFSQRHIIYPLGSLLNLLTGPGWFHHIIFPGPAVLAVKNM